MEIDATAPVTQTLPRRGPEVLFLDGHVWLLLVSAIDATLTWLVLRQGGSEANPLANAVLQTGGFPGLLVFKFGMIGLVIVICEIVGRRCMTTGRRLVWTGVALSCIPIVAVVATELENGQSLSLGNWTLYL